MWRNGRVQQHTMRVDLEYTLLIMLYKIKLSIDVLIEFYTYVFIFHFSIFIKKVRLEKK